MAIALIPVQSAALAAIGYDAHAHELAVLFHTGRTYLYYEVEPDIFDQFLATESKGGYYNRHIRDLYRYVEMDRRQLKCLTK